MCRAMSKKPRPLHAVVKFHRWWRDTLDELSHPIFSPQDIGTRALALFQQAMETLRLGANRGIPRRLVTLRHHYASFCSKKPCRWLSIRN